MPGLVLDTGGMDLVLVIKKAESAQEGSTSGMILQDRVTGAIWEVQRL